MEKTNNKLKAITGLLAVIALAAFIYWPGLDGPFILDDTTNILASHIDNPDWNAFLHTITHNGSGRLGRSVSMISFMLTEWQFGLSSWGYKFHNVLIHIANGLLLYRLLYLLLPLLEPRIRSLNIILTAGITASFWLLHPLLVSTVLYAVQRMVELAVFFTLLSLLCYFKARTRTSVDLKFLVYGWVLFPVTLVLALLSKEIGALIPIYILIFEFLVFKATIRTLSKIPHIMLWLGVFVFIPVLAGSAYLITHFDEMTDYGMRTFTLYDRLLTQLHVVAHYCRLILLPSISEMSLFKDDFPITHSWDAVTILLFALLVGSIISIWMLRNRAPIIAFGLAWFLGSHLLESTIFPLELVFEHRNYLAAVGLLLPCIYYVLQIQNEEVQTLRWFIAIFFIVFVGQTYSRVKEWSSVGVLLTVAIDEHPASPRARTEYVNYIFTMGKSDEAIEQLGIIMELNPRDAGSVIHKLLLHCLRGEREETLLKEAENRLRNWPASVYGLNSLNKTVSSVIGGDCKQLTHKDIEVLLLASLSHPGNKSKPLNYASLLSLMGLYKFTEGKYQEAVDLYLEGFELSGNIVFLSQLARYQIRFKEFEHAQRVIAKIEGINRDRFGIETYTVIQLSNELAEARKQVPSEELENL